MLAVTVGIAWLFLVPAILYVSTVVPGQLTVSYDEMSARTNRVFRGIVRPN